MPLFRGEILRSLIVLLLAALAAPAFAQSTGRLAGHVHTNHHHDEHAHDEQAHDGRVHDSDAHDEEEISLPGVSITVSSPALMGTRTEFTDAAGNFSFPSLPPGVYTIDVEMEGFLPQRRSEVESLVPRNSVVGRGIIGVAGGFSPDDQFESGGMFAGGAVRAVGRPRIEGVLWLSGGQVPSRHFVECDPRTVDQRPRTANRCASNLAGKTVRCSPPEVLNEHRERRHRSTSSETNGAHEALASRSQISHGKGHRTTAVHLLLGDFEAIGRPHRPRIVQLTLHPRSFIPESAA